MIDCHVHTYRCRHASGTAAEYAGAAAAAGVDVLGLTDHFPLLDGSVSDYAMPLSELPDYVAEVSALKADAPVDVLLGIEADWVPGQEAALRDVLAAYPFDLVLGSVHFIDGWAFDDPRLVARIAEWDVDALWERYFDALVAAAASGLFDVISHPDLVKKFRWTPTRDPREHYERAAEAFAAAGVAIEVNSAGLRKPCAELYPSADFLRACRRLGVPSSMGSDAHAPAEVGSGLAEAREALLEAGYDSVVVFRGRLPEERGLQR